MSCSLQFYRFVPASCGFKYTLLCRTQVESALTYALGNSLIDFHFSERLDAHDMNFFVATQTPDLFVHTLHCIFIASLKFSSFMQLSVMSLFVGECAFGECIVFMLHLRSLTFCRFCCMFGSYERTLEYVDTNTQKHDANKAKRRVKPARLNI